MSVVSVVLFNLLSFVVQAVCEDNCFYALTRPDQRTDQLLQDVLVPKSVPCTALPFGRKAKTNNIVDDAVFDMPDDSRKEDDAPMMVFRLVHSCPKSQKLMNKLNRLRGDHIAVTMYPVYHVDGNAKVLSLADQVDPYGNTKLLSLQTFFALGWQKVAKSFLRCEFSVATYCFTASLPAFCHEPEARAVVTLLVQAEAYPGPYGTLTTGSSWSQERLCALETFVDNGLVLNLDERYQISEVGFSCLHSLRDCKDTSRVMMPRVDVAIADRTHWELLFQLHCGGWRALPATGHATRPVPTINPSDDDKKIYFNGRALDVSHTYLQCMVSLEKLAERGSKYKHCCVCVLMYKCCESFP